MSAVDTPCSIRSGRLLLRTLLPADAGPLTELAGNWRVARMLSMLPHPYQFADAEAFITAAGAGARPEAGSHLAITLEGAFLGIVSIADRERGPELGYWLGEPYWGNGFMSEAAAARVASYFNDPCRQRLACGAFADNHASLRIQEKLGFEAIAFGRRHSRARGRDAPHVDTVLTRARYEKHVKR